MASEQYGDRDLMGAIQQTWDKERSSDGGAKELTKMMVGPWTAAVAMTGACAVVDQAGGTVFEGNLADGSVKTPMSPGAKAEFNEMVVAHRQAHQQASLPTQTQIKSANLELD